MHRVCVAQKLLSLFWCSVSLFLFLLSSTIMLTSWLDQYHIAPAPFWLSTILFTCKSLSLAGQTPCERLHVRVWPVIWLLRQTSTTWLIVWGWDHRNHARAIKVGRIYNYICIHTNANWLHCTISSLTLRHSAIKVNNVKLHACQSSYASYACCVIIGMPLNHQVMTVW